MAELSPVAQAMYNQRAMTPGAYGNNPMAIAPHPPTSDPKWVQSAGGAAQAIAAAMMAPYATLAGKYDQVAIDPDGNVQPFDPRMVEDARNLATLTMLGTPDTAPSLASRTAKLYNPPSVPQRSFYEDYPASAGAGSPGGTPAGVSERLTTTLEGDPIGPGYVVGRTTVGGADAPLPPGALDAITKVGTGSQVARVEGAALPRSTVGATLVDSLTGLPKQVNIARTVAPEDFEAVYGHEVGHVIDQVAGQIPTDGLMSELRPLYDYQSNPYSTNQYGPGGWSSSRRLMTPKSAGYSGEEAAREYMAEAIRAYMTDPNSLKTVAPKTAARIRAAVNTNPKLNSIIQFNSGGTPIPSGSGQPDPASLPMMAAAGGGW